jgi:hypothetical protein
MLDARSLAHKFEVLARVLDERTRRLVAAAEAEAHGFGGVTAVAQASGLSRGTVIRGIAELKIAPEAARGQRIRRKGAGRKRAVDRDATLKRDLEALVEPVNANPSFLWTPRRKNWWVTSRTAGGNCAQRAIPRECGCTIS